MQLHMSWYIIWFFGFILNSVLYFYQQWSSTPVLNRRRSLYTFYEHWAVTYPGHTSSHISNILRVFEAYHIAQYQTFKLAMRWNPGVRTWRQPNIVSRKEPRHQQPWYGLYVEKVFFSFFIFFKEKNVLFSYVDIFYMIIYWSYIFSNIWI